MGLFLVVEDDSGTIVEIVSFDVTITENHEAVSFVTESPVEDGSVISDHVINGVQHLSAELMVTNHPIKPRLGILSPDGAEKGSFNGAYESVKLNLPPPFLKQESLGVPEPAFTLPLQSAVAFATGRDSQPDVSVTVLKFEPFDAVTETFNKLEELRSSAALLRVVTTLREYEDMVITRINAPKDRSSGSGARFLVDFAQIKKVNSELVAAPTNPEELRGQQMRQRGGKGAKPINEAQTNQRKQSLLVQGLKASGLVGSVLEENLAEVLP